MHYDYEVYIAGKEIVTTDFFSRTPQNYKRENSEITKKTNEYTINLEIIIRLDLDVVQVTRKSIDR